MAETRQPPGQFLDLEREEGESMECRLSSSRGSWENITWISNRSETAGKTSWCNKAASKRELSVRFLQHLGPTET